MLVAGSEVPNLLEVDAASTLVVSHRYSVAAAGGAMTIAARVKAVRARARVRRWEYRQRNLAHGSWSRFRAALAHAKEAYIIDDVTLATLIAEGCQADTRGEGFEPPRALIWISAKRAALLPRPVGIPLRLNPELLAARNLALVPFETTFTP